MQFVGDIYRDYFRGAKADPHAMDTPVYPIAWAAKVVVETHEVNGARWDRALLNDAVADFGRYLSAQLRMCNGPELSLPADPERSVSWEQVSAEVSRLPSRGLSSIAMVLVPRIRDRRPGAGACIWRPDGGHCIVMQAGDPRNGVRWASWRRYKLRWHLLHELCHTLHLPSRRQHRATGDHCTLSSCVLFSRGNFRVWADALMRGCRRPGLCRACVEELAAGRAEADSGGDALLSWYTRRIQLNPTIAAAYAYRGEEFMRRGQLKDAIADLTCAIELDAMTPAWWSFRGSLYCRSGNSAAAEADLRRCLDLQPGNQAARTTLDALFGKSAQTPRA